MTAEGTQHECRRPETRRTERVRVTQTTTTKRVYSDTDYSQRGPPDRFRKGGIIASNFYTVVAKLLFGTRTTLFAGPLSRAESLVCPPTYLSRGLSREVRLRLYG